MNPYTGFPDWPWPSEPNDGGAEQEGAAKEGEAAQQPDPARPAAAGGPLAGLAAYGVPVSYTPGGWPIVTAGIANQQAFLPPNIPGMPSFPDPPPGLFDGAIGGGGGLMQPIAPVRPFDPRNLVQALKVQDRVNALAQLWAQQQYRR